MLHTIYMDVYERVIIYVYIKLWKPGNIIQSASE